MLFKGKKYLWAEAALQFAGERGVFSLVLLRREVLLSIFGAGREEKVVSSGKTRGKGNCLLLSNAHAMAHSYRQKG